MKFSESWLRTWVDPSISTNELAARLTMAGLEVDSIEACEEVVGDHIIDLDLTPNRADCLSIRGIAREVAALTQSELKTLDIAEIASQLEDNLDVKISDPKACPRFLGRIIRNIDSSKPIPVWMNERLKQCGIRSVSPVVDITNYVMLELGQPMHAYDLAKIEGNIEVRWAVQGEPLTLLDGKEIVLEADTLVIADHRQLIDLAGIMGGLNASVSDQTVDIFLECAYFKPEMIAGRARKYGLSTDASHRFERGVDPQLQRKALERACKLIQSIVGGDLGPITEALHTEYLPQRNAIDLRKHKLEKLLGLPLSTKTCVEILQRLNMQVDTEEWGWRVIPPSYRFDLAIEEDLIEEIARIYGYDRIPSHPIRNNLVSAITEEKNAVQRICEVLVDRGYHETISYSFVDPKLQNIFFENLRAISLANPLSPELSQMRVSLWPSLISSAQFNQRRQNMNLRLFETGTRYTLNNSHISQQKVISGVVIGNVCADRWHSSDKAYDFYDIKGDVEAILYLTKDMDHIQFCSAEHSALHPGQSAKIIWNKDEIGWIGAMHPRIAQKLEITAPVFLFECILDRIQKIKLPQFKSLSKFPAIRRDLSFIIDQNISVQQIKEVMIEAGDEVLQEVQLFDVYLGKGIESGKKSVAVGIVFQHPTRTLKDDEISEYINKYTDLLKDTFAIKLRE